MGLILRKTWRGPKGTRINGSRFGLSVSKSWGPFTVNSRGRLTLRIFKGVSFRKELW